MNATAALQRRVGYPKLIVGRLTTPLLMKIMDIYNRDCRFNITIKTFRLKLTLEKDGSRFELISKEVFANQELANAAMSQILDCGIATISKIRTKEHIQNPPKLFDIETLQIKASRDHNLDSWHSVHLVMALFHKRYLTFPRVTGTGITAQTQKQLPGLLDVHRKHKKYRSHIRYIQQVPITDRLVDDIGPREHEGIFITPRYQHFLTGNQIKIVDMIIERVVQSLSEDCKRSLTDVTAISKGVEFTGKLSYIEQPGWRKINDNLKLCKGDNIMDDALDLVPYEKVKVVNVELMERDPLKKGIFKGGMIVELLRKIYQESDQWARHDLLAGPDITNESVANLLMRQEYLLRINRNYFYNDNAIILTQLMKDTPLARRNFLQEYEANISKYFANEWNKEQWDIYFKGLLKDIVFSINKMPIYNKLFAYRCPKCKYSSVYVDQSKVACINPHCKWHNSVKVGGITLSLDNIRHLLDTRNKFDVEVSKRDNKGILREYMVFMDKNMKIQVREITLDDLEY